MARSSVKYRFNLEVKTDISDSS